MKDLPTPHTNADYINDVWMLEKVIYDYLNHVPKEEWTTEDEILYEGLCYDRRLQLLELLDELDCMHDPVITNQVLEIKVRNNIE
jgi:hypothetical protein